MHKRARARRQLLTSPEDHQPVEMAEPPSFLSPVSSCARKLDIALQRWGDSPGVPQAPDTNRAGLDAMFGAAHAWPSGPAAETNTPAIGPGAFAARSTPFSATPRAGPFARPDIDTRPIRSEQGLTFAEMLAVNANPDAGGEDADERAFGKRKAAAMLCEHPALERASCLSAPPSRSPPRWTGGKENVPRLPNVPVDVPVRAAADAKRHVQNVQKNDDDKGCSRVDDSPLPPLPFFVDPDRGVPSTRADALAARVPGALGFFAEKTFFAANANASRRRTHVLDVRFPHEFRGGHIRGSVNVWDPVEMHRHLLRLLASGREASHHQARTNESFVFVCDAVGDRATRAFRYVRGLDRNDHIAEYPTLTIPHLYVLHGGFEAFVEKHPSLCTGPSVRRDEAMFAAERRAVAAAARDAWRAAGTATSLSRAPDARRFGNGGVHVSAAEHEELERTHEGGFGGEDTCAMRE